MDDLAKLEKMMEVLARATRSNLKRCGRCKNLLPIGAHPATKYCKNCKTPGYQKKGSYENPDAVCQDCGDQFTSKSPTTLRCPTCRAERYDAALGKQYSVELSDPEWKKSNLKLAEAEAIVSVLVELLPGRNPRVIGPK